MFFICHIVCALDPMIYIHVQLWIFFNDHTLHDPVHFSLAAVWIIFPFMMWAFFCVKAALHPASPIFHMDIN